MNENKFRVTMHTTDDAGQPVELDVYDLSDPKDGVCELNTWDRAIRAAWGKFDSSEVHVGGWQSASVTELGGYPVTIHLFAKDKKAWWKQKLEEMNAEEARYESELQAAIESGDKSEYITFGGDDDGE